MSRAWRLVNEIYTVSRDPRSNSGVARMYAVFELDATTAVPILRVEAYALAGDHLVRIA